MSITKLPELTFQIMLELDIKSISNLCQTTLAMQIICQNDYFWKLKFEKDGLNFKEHDDYIFLYHLEFLWRELNNQPLVKNKGFEHYKRSITFDITHLPLSALLTIDKENEVVGRFLKRITSRFQPEIKIEKSPYFGYVVHLNLTINGTVIPKYYIRISDPTEVYNFIQLLLLNNTPYKIVN